MPSPARTAGAADSGGMTEAKKILRETFGLREFHKLQGEIIGALLAGRSAIVIMPTGGGKSLCYQIPSMLRGGTGIVVSPLIALMKDQVDALRQHGVRAACLNSGMPYDEQRRVMRDLRGGNLDMLYVAPERLLTDGTLAMLGEIQLALFAIDEAHCVSRWGHDFRPEYIQLSILAERFANVPRIALTATADEATRRDIAERLALRDAKQYTAGLDRPNITYTINQEGNARRALLEFIREKHPGESGIVYCLSRNNVDQTAKSLSANGVRALAYHAGMDKDAREKNQTAFLREDGVVMAATIAFGMGIDKPDVRFVAHLNLPKNIEAYYQETGRAGRDGLPASAWMRYGLQDIVMLRQMLENSEAGGDFKRVEQRKINALLEFCESPDCRRRVMFAYFGETYDRTCGNCDNCMHPPETWDGSVAAQKAMSCAARTGQRFGAAHLISVLLGRDTEKIRRFGHDKLSVYGIGGEHGEAEWYSIFRQLTAAGLLAPDMHGGLGLRDRSRAVLRGEEPIFFRKLPPRARAKTRSGAAQAKPPPMLHGEDAELFEKLRAARLTLSREQNVPPYVIFHNAALIEMALAKPRNARAMEEVPGVGQVKLERYGGVFLDVIEKFLRARG